MRAFIVAGMVLAANSANAGDFGVDYQAAKKSLTEVIRPSLAEEECHDEVCSFRSAEHDVTASLVLGKGRVVELFGLEFKPNNWAIAAAYGRSIQRELMVPERHIAGLEDIARRAAAGTAGDEITPAVQCTGKQIDGRPTLSCTRR